MKRNDIDTPALLVDAPTLRRNIGAMQKRAKGFGVRLRPHTKTHKSPQIALLQARAGASGITVAKLGEAEVMAEAGLSDVFIANQIVGRQKLERLAGLTDRCRVAVLVDSREHVTELESTFAAADRILDVLIEVDTGKGRCGLSDLYEITALAAAVAESPHLQLRGVETHEGHVPGGAADAGEMESRAVAAGRRLVEVAAALRSAGHEVEEVSVGSTPAAPWTASVPGITEMRPGTYVFNDVNQMAIGQATPEDCALSLLTTTISRPAPGRAVLDGGSKSLFSEPARRGFANLEYSGYGWIRGLPDARITSLSEEHGVVEFAGDFTAIGERVEVIPNHVCPVVNLHEELYLVEGDDVLEIWPVAARGKVR